MRKAIKILGIAAVAIPVVISVNSGCFASTETFPEELSSNPKLEAANMLYKKAMKAVHNGDNMYPSFGAGQFYHIAESYLSNIIAKLKEIGSEQSIDVSKEIAMCEKLYTRVHVKRGKTGGY